MNCIHEERPFSLNDVARLVFVNHYHAGEPLVTVMNKRPIRLDECDISSESALGSQLLQAMNHEFREHSRELLVMQHPTSSAMRVGPLISERLQEHSNRIYSEFPEQSGNLLKEPVQERGEHPQHNKECQGGVHSKFREASQHLLGTLNVGRSRVQAASRVDPQ